MSAAQGCAAIFNGDMPLKMKESENDVFRFPCSEDARMELFRASLSPHRLAGLGHRPFTAVTGVRIPLGTPINNKGVPDYGAPFLFIDITQRFRTPQK